MDEREVYPDGIFSSVRGNSGAILAAYRFFVRRGFDITIIANC